MTGLGINPENSGPISTQHTFLLSFLGAGPGPNIWSWPELVRPKRNELCAERELIVHVLHATLQLQPAEWRQPCRGRSSCCHRPGLRLEVVRVVTLKLVATSVEELVLLLPILEKEENKNDGVDGLLPLWRKKEVLSVERNKCGGEGGR